MSDLEFLIASLRDGETLSFEKIPTPQTLVVTASAHAEGSRESVVRCFDLYGFHEHGFSNLYIWSRRTLNELSAIVKKNSQDD